ncbi:hypothetical protein C809_04468 [Lachnospiraceae bacterium MD335]|nr:hypothetical protein C809_04468 [Lachnospiraceae bacterium MD335]
MIAETDGEVEELLKLRLLMAKTSVKKYEAMERSVCSDGRVHGMLMFCGANRTSRWSGKIVQIQNLPKNYIPDLELARDLVKQGLDMRMNNEIPKEVFSRKQQEVGERIAELEQRMAQYGDVEPATEADVSGKLENLQKLMGQFSMPEDGEFSEEEMDKYVSGVRVYEDRFEWLLNLSPDAGGGLDDAGSPVYFKKITVTPDDERAWFRKHPQWSKSNRYAELEVWIFI